MERDLEDIIKESQEFINLTKKDKSYSSKEEGTPAYLLSKIWLKKYKTYIFYKDVKTNRKP